jgi:hypothetical protein
MMPNRSTILFMWIRYAAVVFFLLYTSFCHGQDTLPNFSVKTKLNGPIILRWKNNYKKVSQIIIQRSHDSSRNFKTLLNVADPRVSPFTYVDAKAPTPYMYYRLFIVIDSNTYLFSAAKKAYWDTLSLVQAQKKTPAAVQSSQNISRNPPKMDSSITKAKPNEKNMSATLSAEENKIQKSAPLPDNGKTIPVDKANLPIADTVKAKVIPKPVNPPATEKQITLKRRDTIAGKIPESRLRIYIDSIVTKTKDTFVLRYNDTLVIKPFVPKEVFRPSTYIFTDREGNVIIQLPEYAVKKYSVDLFDEKGRRLFTIEQIVESPLTIDKVNFLQSGWYRFELKEDGKIKEKNKFFIPKDL